VGWFVWLAVWGGCGWVVGGGGWGGVGWGWVGFCVGQRGRGEGESSIINVSF